MRLLTGLGGDQAVQVERIAPQLEVEEDADGVGQDLADEAMLEMPQAIVREPDVFLMDEPLSNLDAALRVQMRAEISKLHNRLGTTFIYVTHDQVEAMTMGDRIVILKDGVIQQVGTPQEVYARPANVFVAGFIGTPAMNFLRGTLAPADGALVFDTGQLRVPLPATGAAAGLGRADKAVVAGIRPSAIQTLTPGVGGDGATDRTDRTDRGGVLAARVDVVEPMGDVAYITADIGGQTLTVRVDPLDVPQVGQAVALRIDGQALHLFDADTGQALGGGWAPEAIDAARPVGATPL